MPRGTDAERPSTMPQTNLPISQPLGPSPTPLSVSTIPPQPSQQLPAHSQPITPPYQTQSQQPHQQQQQPLQQQYRQPPSTGWSSTSQSTKPLASVSPATGSMGDFSVISSIASSPASGSSAYSGMGSKFESQQQATMSTPVMSKQHGTTMDGVLPSQSDYSFRSGTGTSTTATTTGYQFPTTTTTTTTSSIGGTISDQWNHYSNQSTFTSSSTVVSNDQAKPTGYYQGGQMGFVSTGQSSSAFESADISKFVSSNQPSFPTSA